LNVTPDGTAVTCDPVDRGGRPPGRELTELEERHLRYLLRIRERAHDAKTEFDAELEDFVFELTESGASTRGIARIAGVAHGTVSKWGRIAKTRRRVE
jgi:DNA invertase Pin-like site-specific DNA recombinase